MTYEHTTAAAHALGVLYNNRVYGYRGRTWDDRELPVAAEVGNESSSVAPGVHETAAAAASVGGSNNGPYTRAFL